MKMDKTNTPDNLPSKEIKKVLPLLFDSLENKATKMDIIRTYNGLTLSKVVDNNLPTIGLLQKEYGLEKVELFTGMLIKDLSSSFENDLKTHQIDELTVEINNSVLRNMSLEGIFVACQDLKKSNVIGKLSVSKVLKHLNTFFEEQSKLIMQKNYNNHLAQKFYDPIENRESEKEKQQMRDAHKWFLQQKNI